MECRERTRKRGANRRKLLGQLNSYDTGVHEDDRRKEVESKFRRVVMAEMAKGWRT